LVDEQFDVCVVGSGAGGAPVACLLAEAGLKVLLLERGPNRRHRDFYVDEKRNLTGDFWRPHVNLHRHVLYQPGIGRTELTNSTIPATCVGGGTVQMAAYFHRMHADDLRMRSVHGELAGANVADWPFDYSELSPFYTKVARLIGISGTDGRNPYAPPGDGDGSLPPLANHPIAERIEQACTGLGLHPFKSSMAILPVEHDGRAPCFYCRFCANYGCPTKSKGSTAVTFVRKALASGNCELRTACFVFRIELDRHGHAGRVHYISKGGSRHAAGAKLVCLACSAIETARLLLLSATPTQPNGLANSSGQLGRNLMFSAHSDVSAFVRFGEATDPLRNKNHFVLRSIQDFYRLPHPHWPDGQVPHPAGGTISFYAPADNIAAKAKRVAQVQGSQPLWGRDLKEAIRTRLRDSYMFGFETFGEFLPNEQTRVALSSNYKDQWGFPIAHVTVRPHPATRASNHYLTARGIEILQAMEIDREDIVEHSIGSINPVLIYGTCRAGDDRTTAVLNRWCRSHDVPNLFVTDGSFMPTSGGVPGTFTIMANALRVAEHIRDEELARLL